LPERQKYHGFDSEELHLGVVSSKQFFGGNVEQKERIQSKSNADVVDYCYVQVAMMSPVCTTHRN